MTAAEDQAVAEMCALIGEVLDVPDVAADEDFFELGGTSLKAAALVAQIQRRFSARLEVSDLYEAGTARAVAARLAGQRCPDDSVPVFLVHWYPADLAREIGRSRPAVLLSCASSSHENWPPPVGIDALAAYYVAQMRRVRPTGPYHLAGYSLGGIIAWEMVRQLDESEVGALCLIDAAPPEVRWRALRKRETVRRVAATPPRVLTRKVANRVIRKLSPASTLYRMLWDRRDHLGRLQLIDHRLDRYRMRPFSGRLLLVEGSLPSGHSVLFEDPPSPGQAYAELGLVGGSHRVVTIPADHSTVIEGSSARLIADAIESDIAAI